MGYFLTGLACLIVGGTIGAALMAVCAASGHASECEECRFRVMVKK